MNKLKIACSPKKVNNMSKFKDLSEDYLSELEENI